MSGEQDYFESGSRPAGTEIRTEGKNRRAGQDHVRIVDNLNMKSKTLVLIGIALVVIAGCSGNQITNPVNQPPLITAMAVTPEQAHLGDLVTVSSSAHAPESQNVNFNWTATFGYFIGS